MAEFKTLRIRGETHELLSRLSENHGMSMAELVTEGVKLIDEKLYFQKIKEAYAQLSDQDRREINEEFSLWDEAPLCAVE